MWRPSTAAAPARSSTRQWAWPASPGVFAARDEHHLPQGPGAGDGHEEGGEGGPGFDAGLESGVGEAVGQQGQRLLFPRAWGVGSRRLLQCHECACFS